MFFTMVFVFGLSVVFLCATMIEDAPLDLSKPLSREEIGAASRIEYFTTPLPTSHSAWTAGLAGGALGVLGTIGLRDWSSDPFSSSLNDLEPTVINPASGLPMLSGIGGIDVAGNTYGENHVGQSTGFMDSFFGVDHSSSFHDDHSFSGIDHFSHSSFDMSDSMSNFNND